MFLLQLISRTYTHFDPRCDENRRGPVRELENVAAVAGHRRRSAASVRAAGPRRWVGSRDGCALCGLRTGANGLWLSRDGRSRGRQSAHVRAVWPHSSGVRPLTGVRLVRHTSVDPRRRLSGRVSVLCAAHVAAPLFLEPLPCCLTSAATEWSGAITARSIVCADRASRVRSRAGAGEKQGRRES